MARDINETIYRITVEDIILTAEAYCRDEDEITPEVLERVISKIEAMDFSDISQAIDTFIEDAIQEVKAMALA